MLAICLTAASPWPRKTTHGCFHVFAWCRTKSDRHVLRHMLLKPKKKIVPTTDHQVTTEKWNTYFNEKSKVTILTYHTYIWYRMSTSTLDQHAPKQLKIVQGTTPYPCFASYKIEVSHADCKYEFRWKPRSHSWRFFTSKYFIIIAIDKPYTIARILENE